MTAGVPSGEIRTHPDGVAIPKVKRTRAVGRWLGSNVTVA